MAATPALIAGDSGGDRAVPTDATDHPVDHVVGRHRPT